MTDPHRTDPDSAPAPPTASRPAPRMAAIAAVNDEASLALNLARSPMIASGEVPLHVERGAASAGAAYNRGIDAAGADVLLLVHQDVYFPAGWPARAAAAIAAVEAVDPDWGVIGAWGVDADGRGRGRLWSSSIGGLIGRALGAPVRAQSLDELLIVLRRASGLRFDEAPLWHLYGTDIVQAALAAGAGAWVADLPLVHNDRFHGRLGADFAAGYDHVRRKWRARLPLSSPVVRIDRWGLGLPLYRLRAARSRRRRAELALDISVDPRVYAARCGWEGASGPDRAPDPDPAPDPATPDTAPDTAPDRAAGPAVPPAREDAP